MKRKYNCAICKKVAYSFQNRAKYCSEECHKEAVKIYNKKAYWDNVEESRKRVREYGHMIRKSNPASYLKSSAKTRAKKKSLDFNLEITDIIIPDKCPILGIPIRSHSKLCDNSLSLDRIDNTKGYVKGNVAVISIKANRIKSNSTLEELEKVIEWLKKQA